MLPLIKEETVLVTPKCRYLNPDELAAYRNTFSGTEQEAKPAVKYNDNASLSSLYAVLRKCISAPRIERFNGRSLAVWDKEKSRAKVIRKEGKFETFGTAIDRALYLEYYEALYLLEIGRLQLEFNSCIQSIEQAYLLLLGEESSPKFSKCLVYSYLTRAGYILVEHRNQLFLAEKQLTDTSCIWAWLENKLHNKPIPAFVKRTELFANVKQGLEAIKTSIIEHRVTRPTISDDEGENELPPAKKRKLLSSENNNCTTRAVGWEKNSFLDFLKDEPEYKKFAEIFKKLEIIKMKTSRSLVHRSDDITDIDGRRTENSVCLDFDLYLHNNGFKKNGKEPPLMRVMVLPSSQHFPSHTEISFHYSGLLSPTPILVVSVGDAKQIQAFLYFFTYKEELTSADQIDD